MEFGRHGSKIDYRKEVYISLLTIDLMIQYAAEKVRTR